MISWPYVFVIAVACFIAGGQFVQWCIRKQVRNGEIAVNKKYGPEHQ